MNSCEVNQEEDGDDSSFQMYENSTNSEDLRDLVCTELELIL